MNIAVLSRNPKLYSTRRLVKAAGGCGQEVRVLDLLGSYQGPVGMEVNFSPGLEGMEISKGKDIAGTIVQFIEKNAIAGRMCTRGQG